MPIDPMIARGANVNALQQFYGGQMDRQQNDRRNALVDAQIARMNEPEEDDDAEWDAAYAAKDWGVMARLDPQATKAIWEFEQQKAAPAPAPITEQRLDSGRYLAMQGDKPVGSPWAPPQAPRPIVRAAPKPAAEPAAEPTAAPGPSAPSGVPGFDAMPAGTKMTEVQGKYYLGASMMAESVPTLAAALSAGYVPTREDLYSVGPPLKGIGNSFMQEITPRERANPRANEFFNAGGKILTAILRPESGGAITEDEWTMYGPMYLPWPGDSKEVINKKMTSLNSYMRRLAQVSGGAAQYFKPPAEEKIIDLPTPK